MRKVITINIPRPCSEDWNKMTLTEKGRHCASCKKTVFDFTTKTDEQIVKTFEQNHNVCGRFKTTQLQRDLVLSRKEKNNYLSFVASGLFTFLGITSQGLYSQEKSQIIQANTSRPIIIGKVAPPIPKNDSVVGLVLDESKLPLPGVTILIKGKPIGTVTDFDGKFSINAKNGDILIFNYLGFKTRELKINDNSKYNITLEMTEDVMGELVVIVGGATNSSSYVCTPEELERKRQNKFRRSNYFAFYKKQQSEYRHKIKNNEIERTYIGKLFYRLTNLFR